jgi:hypothetical protein
MQAAVTSPSFLLLLSKFLISLLQVQLMILHLDDALFVDLLLLSVRDLRIDTNDLVFDSIMLLRLRQQHITVPNLLLRHLLITLDVHSLKLHLPIDVVPCATSLADDS